YVSVSPLSQVLRSFFFSSRRRHTSFSRDWSSDVCSSDLPAITPAILSARRSMLLPPSEPIARPAHDVRVLVADVRARTARGQQVRATEDGLDAGVTAVGLRQHGAVRCDDDRAAAERYRALDARAVRERYINAVEQGGGAGDTGP